MKKLLLGTALASLLSTAANATISSSTVQAIDLGNNSTTVFNYGFLIPYQADGSTPAVTVQVENTNGSITTLNPSQYTISGVGNPLGGTVTYNPPSGPLPTGASLIITRNLNYTQPIAVSNFSFYPHTVEISADTLAAQIQQLAQTTQQTMQFPNGDSTGFVFPPAALRANSYPCFGTTGLPGICASPGNAATTAFCNSTVDVPLTYGTNGFGLCAGSFAINYAPTTQAKSSAFQVYRLDNYTGGTAGTVSSAANFYMTAPSGRLNYSWTAVFNMVNSGTSGDASQNVASYFRSQKLSTGATWATTSELDDTSANPVVSSVTDEHDLIAKGTDSNSARVIEDTWGKSFDGNADTVAWGYRLNGDSHTTINTGFGLGSTGSTVYGFSCHAATITADCFVADDQQPLELAQNLSGGRELFHIGSSTNAWVLRNNGTNEFGFYDDGGLVVSPTATTGGDQGGGTINAQAYYINGHLTANTIQLGKLIGANFNSTSDQAIAISGGTLYVVDKIIVTNCSTNLTTAQGAFYISASKTNPLFNMTTTTPFTWLTGSARAQEFGTGSTTGGAGNGNSYGFTASTNIYLSLTSAQGSSATCDIYVYGTLLVK